MFDVFFHFQEGVSGAQSLRCGRIHDDYRVLFIRTKNIDASEIAENTSQGETGAHRLGHHHNVTRREHPVNLEPSAVEVKHSSSPVEDAP